MYSKILEENAKNVALAERLIELGVSFNSIRQEFSMSKLDIEKIIKCLEIAPPGGVNRSNYCDPTAASSRTIKNSICTTLLLSTYQKIRVDFPEMKHAEIFLICWNTFLETIHPILPARLDINAKMAWLICKAFQNGLIATSTCMDCGAIYPSADWAVKKCGLCFQLQYTNCSTCEVKLDRFQTLIDKKWKQGESMGLCAKCHVNSSRRKNKAFTSLIQHSREQGGGVLGATGVEMFSMH